MSYYFTKQYEEYYKELKDLDKLKEYKTILSDSVHEVIELSHRLVEQMNDLAGVPFEQMDEDFQKFVKQFIDEEEIINNDFEQVCTKCTSLSQNLKLLKTNDDTLYNSWYFGGYVPDPNNPEEAEDVEEYERLKRIDSLCQRMIVSIDNDIEYIQSFNGKLEDYSLETLSLSLALDNNQDIDIERMSPDEKKAYLEKAIEKYTQLYEDKRKLLLSNRHDGLVSVLTALGYPYDISMDGPFNYKSFMMLHTFINTKIVGDKTPIDVINDYFNGQTWEESGMASLAILIGNTSGMKVTNATDVDYEAEFWRMMIFEIDGRGTNNNPSPYFLMSTDYCRENGCPDFDGIYDYLFIDASTLSPEDFEYYASLGYDTTYTTGRYSFKNMALIESLKGEFVDQGYLAGLNDYVAEINGMYDEYGEALPFLEALDGRMDWTDNNSVIPKEAIMSYLSGASWEESELALYCGGKTEEEFLHDLVGLYGTEYSIHMYTDEEFEENLRVNQNSAWFGFEEKKTSSFFWKSASNPEFSDQMSLETASVEDIKEVLRSKGVAEKVGNYYDYVDARNDQIEAESTEMFAISTSVRSLRESLAETDPTPQDLLRAKNKAQGQQMAEGYFGVIEGISGKNEHIHVMTQDEYVAQRQLEDPTLTRDEILSEYRAAWQTEYETELVTTRNYNPECARRMAATQTFEGKQVVVCDDLNPLESVLYFGREVASDLVVGGSGLGLGTLDLARDLKHSVAPDLVPTPLEYMEEEIAIQFNDPNSPHYDPLKGGIYSTSRTLGHDAPVEVLKAIPATRTVGEVLEFVEKHGQQVNKAYQANGGNYVAAQTNALGHDVLKVVTKSIGGSGDSVLEKVVTTGLAGEINNVGGNYLDAATGMQTFDQARDKISSGHVGVVVDMVKTGITSSNNGQQLEITGSKPIDTFLNKAGVEEAGLLTKAVLTGDGSALADQNSVIANAGKATVGDTIKDGVKRKTNEYYIEKEFDAGTLYYAEDGKTVMHVNPAGHEDYEVDLDTYQAKKGADFSSAASSASKNVYTGTNSTIEAALSSTTKSEDAPSVENEQMEQIVRIDGMNKLSHSLNASVSEGINNASAVLRDIDDNITGDLDINSDIL